MTDPAAARDALVRGLESEPGAATQPPGWTARYYALATLDSLQARTPADLAVMARRHLEMVRRRKPGEILIEVHPPRDPAATGCDAFATIDTCADDMPFIVDTVTMAVREAGVPIDWTVHPILKLARDAAGTLQGFDESAPAESLIHFEIEPLADEAAYGRLRDSLAARFADLRLAVQDFPAMSARARSLIAEMARARASSPSDDAAESREFLQWLDNDRFTYLAIAETQVEMGPDGKPRFVRMPKAGLGLAQPGARFADTDALIAPPDELAKYAESPRIVVLTKALQRSPIHHDEFMDVVSVKHHRADGSVAGTTRILGLFSGEAYLEPPAVIPIVRRKAAMVVQRSGYDPEQHSGKTLLEILHGLPRDELFQSGEDELFQTCMGIMALRDRHQLRLFLRRDRYGRFFSALVYLPRDRYSRELRDRVAQELLAAVRGQSIDRTVEFLRGGRTRIHYLVRTPPGTVLQQSAADIERQLVAVTRPWRDQLREALSMVAGASTAALATRFADAFSNPYIERTPAAEAAADTLALARLSEAVRVLPRLQADGRAGTRLKLYTWRQSLALSDVLPTLENFGLRVIRQDPEPVVPKGAAGDDGTLWVQDYAVELPNSDAARDARVFEEALLGVFEGRAEDDGLNRLVLAAGLDGRQVVGLRTLAKYLNQIGLPYGRADIERIIAENAPVAKLVAEQFQARFDPAHAASRRPSMEVAAAQALDEALDQVASLDADRILRVLVSVVRAGLRTNFWQRDAGGLTKPYVSLKLDPRKVLELPQPLPMYEIWVYAPEVEGIHLRGGRVARGGLRWSDRREDFRTEVLGLMKAQSVKNAVIVPVGAKGGFVVKKGPPPAERDAWMANGIACYKTFLRGLLDLTDNRVGDGVVPPPDVVRHDDDDPYLVVAADKGTATFSDIANGLAGDYGFWLGDAFASGGSAGYDHKKMGITARGAWESVKRHFRELGKDIQAEAFTVVGVGDMSGDVFGNGMLLSPHIRLVAAFDHRHIFLDPHPVAATGFAERRRLFDLPRSSWADYDAKLISAGGGVFPRTLKHIKLSAEAQVALGTDRKSATPAELMKIILQAPVDLFWNGGIGTYVKASSQGHDTARDRANDMLRVNGRDMRARVVGEGGNLGFTQAGRIEYARRGAGGAGGRINTDAIDNSGGVHSSDREVNLKIPLNQLMKEEGLSREDRDQLLVAMTDDIARFVLRDSYVQSAAISLIEGQASARVDEHAALIRRLEREGLLDRALEGLPDDEELQERRSEGIGLTRPEIAVLIAYSKISLKRTALSSEMSDDPFFVRDLLENFPPAMVERHRDALTKHRLRREIIATILANAVVNRMGASFAHRLADDHGVPHDEVLAAYAAAHELFGGNRYWTELEGLDGRIPARLQYRLMEHAASLMKHATGWIIGAGLYPHLRVGEIVARYRAAVPQVEAWIPTILPPTYREDFDRHLAAFRKEGVPEAVAERIVRTKALGCALDLADLAGMGKVALGDAAEIYFQVGERLRMPWLHGAIVGLRVSGHWQALARSRLRDDAYRLHRLIAASVVVQSSAPPAQRFAEWLERHERRVTFSLGRLQELQATGAADYASLAVAVRELHDLHALQAAPSPQELTAPRQKKKGLE